MEDQVIFCFGALNQVFVLLGQALSSMSGRKYCYQCLAVIKFNLEPLYTPNSPLAETSVNLDYFDLSDPRRALFEELLRTVQDCRFYLEEILYLSQKAK